MEVGLPDMWLWACQKHLIPKAVSWMIRPEAAIHETKIQEQMATTKDKAWAA
jgi:hypothetical protein